MTETVCMTEGVAFSLWIAVIVLVLLALVAGYCAGANAELNERVKGTPKDENE